MSRTKNLPATRKKNLPALPPVKYRDTDGNTWEAIPGQPNGTFRVPGSDKTWSVKSFIKFLERNIATVKVLGKDDIVDQGPPSFEDALQLMGTTEPRPLTGKGKLKSDEKWNKVKEYLKGRAQAGATKKQIAEATDLAMGAVTATLTANKDSLEDAGKSGNEKKFRLK